MSCSVSWFSHMSCAHFTVISFSVLRTCEPPCTALFYHNCFCLLLTDSPKLDLSRSGVKGMRFPLLRLRMPCIMSLFYSPSAGTSFLRVPSFLYCNSSMCAQTRADAAFPLPCKRRYNHDLLEAMPSCPVSYSLVGTLPSLAGFCLVFSCIASLTRPPLVAVRFETRCCFQASDPQMALRLSWAARDAVRPHGFACCDLSLRGLHSHWRATMVLQTSLFSRCTCWSVCLACCAHLSCSLASTPSVRQAHASRLPQTFVSLAVAVSVLYTSTWAYKQSLVGQQRVRVPGLLS